MTVLREEVFISYSHKDARWLERLQVMLTPIVRQGMIQPWDDTVIKAGQRWREEIAAALERAGAAVLLVSADFLHSDFIYRNELPPLLAATKERGLTILWVPIDHNLYDDTEIASYKATLNPDRPLIEMTEAEQSRALKEVCRQIKETVSRIHPQPAQTARLYFSAGSPVCSTRLFARPRIVLGRPRLSADLWLTLFPMTDPLCQRHMNGFSRSHAEICWENGFLVRDCDSRAGSHLDGQRLDGRWQPLGDGQLLDFGQGILKLRTVTGDGWLLLERLDNGREQENYLLLQGPVPVPGTDGVVELRPEAGGFTLMALEKDAKINVRPLNTGTTVGLRDGDRVEAGPLFFEFFTGAYQD